MIGLTFLRLVLRGMLLLTSLTGLFALGLIAFAADVLPPGDIIMYSTRADMLAASEIVVLDVDHKISYVPVSMPGSYSPVWSADGGSLFFINGTHIYQVDADGRNLTQLSPELGAINELAVSHDGRWLSYVTSVSHESNSFGAMYEVFALDVSTGEVIQLTDDVQDPPANFPAWSPDGHLAYQVGGGRFAVVFVGYVADDARMGEAQQVPDYRGVRWPAWSPDGRQLVVSSLGESAGGPWSLPPGLHVLHIDSGEIHRISDDLNHTKPAWTNDGDSLIFHAPYDGKTALFIVDVEQQTVRQLTSGANLDSDASVRPTR